MAEPLQPENSQLQSQEKYRVEIDGKEYFFDYKQGGSEASPEACKFVHENWERSLGEEGDIKEELRTRELENIKDEEGKIIGICSYAIYKEGTPREGGDGYIAITLVDKNYRRESGRVKGIGYLITKKAADRIIEEARKRADFKPPVIIKARPSSPGGLRIMEKLEKEYDSKDVSFDVDREAFLL